MTRAHKRDVDKDALREHWKEQAAAMGFDPGRTMARARENRKKNVRGRDRRRTPGSRPRARRIVRARDRSPSRRGLGRATSRGLRAVRWAAAHLSEREAVFTRKDLLTAALAKGPGAVSLTVVERAAPFAGGKRTPAPRAGARGRRRHDHGRNAGAREREHRADAGGKGPERAHHARLDRADAAAPGSIDGRPEGSGEN